MNLLLSRMDEQQRRWYVGLESMRAGRGGDALLCQITGINAETIRRGRRELEDDLQDRPLDRIRLEGGGRLPVENKDATIEPDLTQLVEAHSGGSPMGGCKWVRRSLRHLSDDLGKQGHHASPKTVARLLRKQDFFLRANVKRLSGQAPPADRDLQFRQQREQFSAAGLPTISVDAKKKELVGNFKNAGVLWCRQPTPVNTYDFIHDAQGRATPYHPHRPAGQSLAQRQALSHQAQDLQHPDEVPESPAPDYLPRLELYDLATVRQPRSLIDSNCGVDSPRPLSLAPRAKV